ncbi:unnamed protein product [Camellia sinensis]|uniref:PPM-type phosphatase domain-containing protein n=1 Tax=Camellia sinensis TaxID=4442 RepID=A0A7J7GC37_CAMSI|nr:hypothetical protein HYC85_025361 [Camellia sinensis]
MHEILQKALLRTIHDIDTKFSLEAFNNRYISGSTATIVLLVDGQILVASVGDSKALLCSEKIKSALGDEVASITVLDVEELTRDHHPDRDDERARIEAAGGFVRLWGVPRVNGILAVSRSIGDVYLKRFLYRRPADFNGTTMADKLSMLPSSKAVFTMHSADG